MRHHLILAGILLSVGLVGCQQQVQPQETAKTDSPSSAVQAESAEAPKAVDEAAKPGSDAAPAAVETAQAPSGGMVHDPMHPPVDCPFAKMGLDPTKMKPFEQIEAYINFLDREDRLIWQKPTEVVDALELSGNERIVDVGAGSGYFTFPLAAKVPNGRVFAADVEPEMIRHIHHNAMLKGINNIEVKLIDSVHPEMPENVDVVFISDVLHHIADPVDWLGWIAKQLPKNAKIYMIEFKEGEIPNGPPEAAKIPKDKLMKIAEQAGLKFNKEITDLLPYQTFLCFSVGE